MKYLILFLFFTFTTSVFASNDLEFERIDTIDVIESSLVNNETEFKVKATEKNNTIAFKCYYTMEWLYKECPFIERLEAVV